jgi:hypothetical protein
MTLERFEALLDSRPEMSPILVLGRGNGKVETICQCSTCLNFPKPQRFSVLPCGCRHQTLVACTCKWRERNCNGCHRSYVQVGKQWLEITDPHDKGKTTSAADPRILR